MDNLGYLLAAFVVIWAVLLGYLFILNGRMKRLKKEVDIISRSNK